MKSSRFIQLDLSQLIDEYRYHKRDLDSYQGRDKTKPIQCYCPICPKVGEPNSKPTLYVYPSTLTYYCFRCHTFGVDKSIKLNSKEILKNKLITLSHKEDATLPDLVFHDIDISNLPRIKSEEYISYFLDKRSPKYISHLKEWDLREITFSGRKGIFIPFYYEGKVLTYQIRYIDDLGKMRYYTKDGIKIPYFPTGYHSGNNYDTITLVEGVFDALAASIFKLPNPIAVLGSQLPEQIISIVTKLLRPKNIIYAFDDMDINNRLKKQFFNYMHEAFYIDTDKSDLDEYLRYGKTPQIKNYNESNESYDNEYFKLTLKQFLESKKNDKSG